MLAHAAWLQTHGRWRRPLNRRRGGFNEDPWHPDEDIPKILQQRYRMHESIGFERIQRLDKTVEIDRGECVVLAAFADEFDDLVRGTRIDEQYHGQ